MLLLPNTGEDTALPAPYLMVLQEVGFTAPPRAMRFSTNLFGASPDERQLTLRAPHGENVG